VIWLEPVSPKTAVDTARSHVTALRSHLEPYGLADALALYPTSGEALPREVTTGCLGLDAAVETDLLLNLFYEAPPATVARFRRSALLDIDPGLLQVWVSAGQVRLAPHSVYFTIGETVGRPTAQFPDAGLEWQYTPPCVALDWWPVTAVADDAPFTTVSHWYAEEWLEAADGSCYRNDKRTGFLPFLDLPERTGQRLELAVCLRGDEEERMRLEEKGWRVCEANEVAATPWGYQRYIQSSRGEFSCVKPSCIRFQNAWISDRTLCYLASGRPAVVEHTGPSRFLPDAGGLLRFHNVEEAANSLELVESDYDRQCRLARALAEEHFDGRKVVQRLLERALA
jgi:hypothetical protein